MTIKITPNETGNPPGKVADAELHFTEGPLAGLKLIGFSIWARRNTPISVALPTTVDGLTITFPSRQYTVNGDRRSFALLRPVTNITASTALRDVILAAYRDSVVPS
jgi:hypothetical protein